MQLKCIIENPASGGNTNYLVLFSPIDVAVQGKNAMIKSLSDVIFEKIV